MHSRMSKRADRVAHIVDLMSTFAWYQGASVNDLCEAWDVSRAYVQELAREAGRRIAANITEPEYVSAIVAQSLSRVLDKAEAERDYRSVVAAAAAWYKIASLRAPDPTLLPTDVTDDEA